MQQAQISLLFVGRGVCWGVSYFGLMPISLSLTLFIKNFLFYFSAVHFLCRWYVRACVRVYCMSSACAEFGLPGLFLIIPMPFLPRLQSCYTCKDTHTHTHTHTHRCTLSLSLLHTHTLKRTVFLALTFYYLSLSLILLHCTSHSLSHSRSLSLFLCVKLLQEQNLERSKRRHVRPLQFIYRACEKTAFPLLVTVIHMQQSCSNAFAPNIFSRFLPSLLPFARFVQFNLSLCLSLLTF